MSQPCQVVTDAVGAAVSKALTLAPGQVIITEPAEHGFLITAADGQTDTIEIPFCLPPVRSKSLTGTIERH